MRPVAPIIMGHVLDIARKILFISHRKTDIEIRNRPTEEKQQES